VKPGCNQLPGKTWKAFFERCAQKNMEKEKNASAKDREARLNHTKANKTHQMPGHKGPHVFYWEEIDGFHILTLWTCGETEMSFDSYKNSQRIYDAFSNAWDCCTEFKFSLRDENKMDLDNDGPPYGWLKPVERDPQLTSLPGGYPQPPSPPLPSPKSLEHPPSLFSLPFLADVSTIVEKDPPPTFFLGLSTSPQHPPSSSSLPLKVMVIDRLDHPERDPQPTSLPGKSSQPPSLPPLLSVSLEHPPPLSLLPPLADDVSMNVERDLLPPPPLPPPFPGLSTSPQHPPSSSSLPPETMTIDGLDHPEKDGHIIQPVPDLELDLFNASKQDAISVYFIAPIVEPLPEPQSLEELLHF
jgi:hypothetical protein